MHERVDLAIIIRERTFIGLFAIASWGIIYDLSVLMAPSRNGIMND